MAGKGLRKIDYWCRSCYYKDESVIGCMFCLLNILQNLKLKRPDKWRPLEE